MKSITMQDLILRDYNPSGISNYSIIDGICCICKCNFTYSNVKKFLRNRSNKVDKKNIWSSCQKCWYTENTLNSEEWKLNNSKAQKIAQNRPEQKKKNSDGVKASYTDERRKRCSNYLKDRWQNDLLFRKKALQNIAWTQNNDSKFRELMKKSVGSGGLRGNYLDIDYDSALELSFILWCHQNQIQIKRFDLDPIPYIDEKGKDRLYFPDFIINNNTIVEIKGFGLYFTKHPFRNICKITYLKKWADKNNFHVAILTDKDPVLKENYKKARRIHHENKKQENDSV